MYGTPSKITTSMVGNVVKGNHHDDFAFTTNKKVRTGLTLGILEPFDSSFLRTRHGVDHNFVDLIIGIGIPAICIIFRMSRYKRDALEATVI